MAYSCSILVYMVACLCYLQTQFNVASLVNMADLNACGLSEQGPFLVLSRNHHEPMSSVQIGPSRRGGRRIGHESIAATKGPVKNAQK